MENETSINYQYNVLLDILSEMVTTYLTTNSNENNKKGSASDERPIPSN
ncbi:hypothetical protein [Sediminibacillus halophilus]|nr:hypothetical protein [Sediminibacillus halophilus]